MGFIDQAIEPTADQTAHSDADRPNIGGIVAPDVKALEDVARALLDGLPEDMAPRYTDLPIEIHDLPEPHRLEALDLTDPFDLIGHFEAAEDAADGADPVLTPGRLLVFRRPLLDFWAEMGGSLSEALSDVLIGEIERRVAALADASEKTETAA